MKTAYDIDGVITGGIIPRPGDIIITGRSFEESPETYRYLHSLGLFNAVYFNPKTFEEKTPDNSGQHKGYMLVYLGIEEFYEDSGIQIQEILKIAPNVLIHKI